jgi:C1A family cysteine protease
MPEEFANMLGLDNSDIVRMADKRVLTADNESEGGRRNLQATAVNWVTAGKVLPVKNQGYCGSCWSFAATLAQETMQAIADDAAPINLSEQEGVDCTTNTQANYDLFGEVYGTYGCQGGWMARYWNFSRDHGSMSAADYPYTAYDYRSGDSAQACAHNDAKVASRAGDSGQITGSIGDAVIKMQDGPLTFAVAAGNDCWRFYESGILTSADGCPTSLDHAVVAVGVDSETITVTTQGDSNTTCRKASRSEKRNKSCSGGAVYGGKKCCTTTTTEGATTTETVNYWLIQNSWSDQWGENGFIKLAIEGGYGVSGSNQVMEWVTVQ